MFFAAAALLSVIIGAQLSGIKAFASRIIDSSFPVSYNVAYRTGEHQAVENAHVRFEDDTAYITANGVTTAADISDAVFTCTEKELRSQNTVRGFLLFILIAAAAYSIPFSFVCFGFSLRAAALAHSGKKAVSQYSSIRRRQQGARPAPAAA